MTNSVVPYRTLVEKAYIEPIRSVVVVDDDFPTLDKLLASAVQPKEVASVGVVDALNKTASTESSVAIDGNSGGAPSSIQFSFNGTEQEVRRAADLIAACRNRTPPWIVDIHDGSPNDGVDELDLAPSLHHSDLMILDYHLNGDGGDGQRAIDILRALAKNGQFNLVVVFTKGIQGSLEPVFEQIWTGLLSKDDDRVSAEKLLALQDFVAKWEDECGDEISASLLERTSTRAYLRQRSGEDVFVADSLNEVFKQFLATCPDSVLAAGIRFSVDGTEQTSRITPKDLFEYGLSARREKLLSSHSDIGLGNIKWNYSDNANWLRLDQLFLTVVNKGDATPSDLVDRLTAALVDWEPGPHQLLMTKMRNQLGEYGVVDEAAVLADRALQSGWLHQMLGPADAKVVMAQSVNRHWDALGDGILDRVSQYGHDLIGHFRSRDKDAVFAKHSQPEFDEKKRLAHLNHYYSSKPVESTNLTTGHIIRIENAVKSAASSVEHWICLSPACDLVPGQVKKNSWRSRLGEAIPFIGVQLTKEPIADALKNINHNRHVFIKDDDGSIVSYAFSGPQTVSTPVWEQMFALDSGAISAEKSGVMTVSVQRMSFVSTPVLASNAAAESEAGSSIAEASTGLKFVNFQARVVSQLRYEYALNLLQRLGSSLSRVGLDFQGS